MSGDGTAAPGDKDTSFKKHARKLEAKRAEQAEQAKRAEQAEQAEQAKRAEQAEQAKREQIKLAEQAKEIVPEPKANVVHHHLQSMMDELPDLQSMMDELPDLPSELQITATLKMYQLRGNRFSPDMIPNGLSPKQVVYILHICEKIKLGELTADVDQEASLSPGAGRSSDIKNAPEDVKKAQESRGGALHPDVDVIYSSLMSTMNNPPTKERLSYVLDLYENKSVGGKQDNITGEGYGDRGISSYTIKAILKIRDHIKSQHDASAMNSLEIKPDASRQLVVRPRRNRKDDLPSRPRVANVLSHPSTGGSGSAPTMATFLRNEPPANIPSRTLALGLPLISGSLDEFSKNSYEATSAWFCKQTKTYKVYLNNPATRRGFQASIATVLVRTKDGKVEEKFEATYTDYAKKRKKYVSPDLMLDIRLMAASAPKEGTPNMESVEQFPQVAPASPTPNPLPPDLNRVRNSRVAKTYNRGKKPVTLAAPSSKPANYNKLNRLANEDSEMTDAVMNPHAYLQSTEPPSRALASEASSHLADDAFSIDLTGAEASGAPSTPNSQQSSFPFRNPSVSFNSIVDSDPFSWDPIQEDSSTYHTSQAGSNNTHDKYNRNDSQSFIASPGQASTPRTYDSNMLSFDQGTAEVPPRHQIPDALIPDDHIPSPPFHFTSLEPRATNQKSEFSHDQNMTAAPLSPHNPDQSLGDHQRDPDQLHFELEDPYAFWSEEWKQMDWTE